MTKCDETAQFQILQIPDHSDAPLPRPEAEVCPEPTDDVERYTSRIEKSDEDREQDIHSLGRVSR